jgi:hypothetical protein
MSMSCYKEMYLEEDAGPFYVRGGYIELVAK